MEEIVLSEKISNEVFDKIDKKDDSYNSLSKGWALGDVSSICSLLRDSTLNDEQIEIYVSALENEEKTQSIKNEIERVSAYWTGIKSKQHSWKKYIPAIHFHADNQYHQWLFGSEEDNSKGILRGDFGKSIQSGLPVSEMLLPRFIRSFIIVFISLLLAFIISIPLSIYLVLHPEKIISKFLRSILLALYITPVFWLAVLLLMLFANPNVFSIFPLSGWAESGSGFFTYCFHLILPVTCYCAGAIAYFTRMLETNFREVLHKEFLMTARAKGLAEKKSVLHHALPHAVIPALTVLGYLFPMAVSGSVIIETIFGIPGMSQALFQASLAKDVPVLAAVSTLSCALTLVGFLLTEILQAIIDPRLRNSSQLS